MRAGRNFFENVQGAFPLVSFAVFGRVNYGECIHHGRESHAMPLRRFHEESADNAEAAALFIGYIVPHF